MTTQTLKTLVLTGFLTVVTGSAFAGSTGPTNPVDNAPKTPISTQEKNTDGTTTGPKGTSPGTKGMDPEPDNTQSGGNGNGGGMSNGQGMGGSGGGGESGGASK